MKPPLFFIHHPLLFQSTKKISDSPIKFPSSPSSSKDDLAAHQSSEEDVSSDDWRSSDYSPLWSSEKEDLEEEERTRMRTTPTPTTMTPTLTLTLTSPHLLPSERGELRDDHMLRLSSL
jgi:hypothetical protein